ncbi:MAG: hypothetical protein P8J87_09395, partial [Verrucomicrobiales bacterium]|nr:hypothetical protein [Verrucomicrobiales bacterium]
MVVATGEAAITCPKCGGPNSGVSGEGNECATCRSRFDLRVFPALSGVLAEGEDRAARAVFEGGGATCFFCEGQTATVACGG